MVPDIVLYIDPKTGELHMFVEGSKPEDIFHMRRIGLVRLEMEVELDRSEVTQRHYAPTEIES